MNYYLGIDLGGTNVRTILIDDEGVIHSEISGPSYANEGLDQSLAVIVSQLESLDYSCCGSMANTKGIGIGVPGLVDVKKKEITTANNLKGYEGFNLCGKLEEKFNLPCYIDNDANVAGLAEAVLGAGKGYESVYYITISTGIGGAYIYQGKVIGGNRNHAGEVGNMIVDSNAPKIGGMNAGAIETIASGTALTKLAQSRISLEVENAGDVFKLAGEGNRDAIAIVNNAIVCYSNMLANIAHTIDPHCFVLGGGVMKSADYFFNTMEIQFNNKLYPGMVNQTPIFKTTLELPGAIGAAMLVKSHL